MTPRDFGLYVRAHPDVLTVTALNKMRYAEQRTFDIKFTGELEESVIVPSDEKITEKNRQFVSELFEKLSKTYPEKSSRLKGAYFWKNVGWEEIEEFLMRFRPHKQIINKRNALLEYLRKISEKYPEVDIAFISLKRTKEDSSSMSLGNKWDIFCQERSVGTLKGGSEIRRPTEEDGFYIGNKQRMSSRGVESVGLTDEQRQKAKIGASDKKNIPDLSYRTVRGKPLLMIHLLKLIDETGKSGEKTVLLDQVPAMGISFPVGDYSESFLVRYVVNQIWVQQDMFDGPEEEDDNDS